MATITTATLPITFGPATEVTGTFGVQECKVYAGGHHVANVQHTGTRYYVMGLHYGSTMVHTYNRLEIADLVRTVAPKVYADTMDCTWECMGKH